VIHCHIVVTPTGFVFDFENQSSYEVRINPISLMNAVNAMRRDGVRECDLNVPDGDVYVAYMEWRYNANLA
jgi:hypothetical protein